MGFLIFMLIVAVLLIVLYGGLVLASLACAAFGLVLMIVGVVKKRRLRDKSTDDSEACIFGGAMLFGVGVLLFIVMMWFAGSDIFA